MKLAALFIALMLVSPAPALGESLLDAQHVATSAACTVLFSLIVKQVGISSTNAALWGGTLTNMAGFMYEAGQNGGRQSDRELQRSLTSNFVGSVVGGSLFVLTF